MSRVRNDLFKPTMVRGRSILVEGLWYLIKVVFLLSSLPWPNDLKLTLLRLFGATVGKGVIIRPRVNITFPWKLEIGNHSWIGEEVYILNLEFVTIGNHCTISQRAFICTGNHDFRTEDMTYTGKPIVIGDGTWICAQVFVGPGVQIGADSVITAGSVAVSDVPANSISQGNPCVQIGQRWKT
ncbi:MAG: WcaF family extracellular polysaccharide biosynthesis acetyltransferase [Verrucomicrobiota bacterium]|nr:WcaF family extracellular polysaccharide biosynthesis acetyltransferase [Verrucomicrobiota bacterium]